MTKMLKMIKLLDYCYRVKAIVPSVGPHFILSSTECFITLPKRQISSSSKLEEIADDNFEFSENCRKFSKELENTVGKGEIAHYEQFLLFPQCFRKTYTADM